MYLEYIPDRYGVFRKEYPNLSFCRVTLQEKGLYQVISSEGAHQARVSGKFQYDAKTVSDYPAVGDYVMADLNDTDTAIIHTLLPTRYAIRKDTKFDTTLLEGIAGTIPAGYELRKIDAELYDLCLKDPVTRLRTGNYHQR